MEEVKRVYGPYKQRNGTFRVAIIKTTGKRESFVYQDKQRALRALERFQPKRADTVRRALDEYLLMLKSKGRRKSHTDTTRHRLERLLWPVIGASVAALTPSRVQSLYEELAGSGVSGTYAVNTLGQARTWGRWLVETGRAKHNAWVTVKPRERRKKGKPQLRVNELRKLVALCFQERSDAAVGVLCALFLGMRAGEIAGLLVRDVDAGGKLLWIEQAKTEAGKRTLEVPAFLQPLLLERAADRGSHEKLLPLSRHSLHKHCRKLCRRAGVPEVCPHSLRGSHATLSVTQGTSAQAVADALGQTGPQVTRDHYIVEGTEAKVGQGKLREALFPEGLPGA